MQITLDLAKATPAEAKRGIAGIAAYFGITVEFPESKQERVNKIVYDEVMKVDLQPAITQDAAAIFGAAPLVQAAPAIVGAAALPIAPVAPAVTSLPTPPAMPLPVAMPDATVSAPAVAAPTAPAPSVDADGLPWDARIHASSKAINADGRWRAKKGLNDGAMVAAVQAELRSLMAIPVPPVVAAPAAMPLPVAPVVIAPPAINTVAPTTLPEFMPLVSAGMMAGKVTVDQVNAELVALGVAGGVTALMSRPDLVTPLWATLQAKYAL